MKGNSTSLLIRSFAFLLFSLLWSDLAFSQLIVSGNISSTIGEQFSDIAVLAIGTENKVAYTDNNGNFTFTLQAGGAYEIRPIDCRANPLNGVTTFDRVLIAQHYMGINPLSTPYKIIAADLDNSGIVDSLDNIVLTSLILGIITELPSANQRFIPQDHVFPNPLDPFSQPFPQSIFIADLQTDISNTNFFALKVADVNDSAVFDGGCNDVALPAVITGKVFRDQTPDCQFNAGEPALFGWKVTATGAAGTFYATTNATGNYNINLLPGTYDVTLIKPNDLWEICTETVLDVVATIASGAAVDFAVQEVIACPALELNLSSLALRRCFNNRYVIHYCNFGTATAENVRVELDLDPFFSFESSTVPETFIAGNTYSFAVGDVPSGACGQFSLQFNLSCMAELGQTHCVEGRIFPDTVCVLTDAWTGPDLHVAGVCDGTDVKFTISNHGSAMLVPSSYIVIEDIVVMAPPINNPFTLPAGGSEVITVPANGTTVRLEVNQPAGHPWSDKASATVEGCGSNAGGSHSTGMVNLFPLNDKAPTVDIDCQQNIGSYDPNDKQGIPLGVLAEHYIPLHQPIEYTIRFQNTGTDTAFTVLIRDTLDEALDVSSIRPLGSSHPYTFNLTGEGVAQFIFSHIMLPDSNTNEAASHGYVKYSIAPKQSATEGSIIENSAAIYFDFNEQVRTNTTWHTLGAKFLGASTVLFNPSLALEVFPNPTSDRLNFLIKSTRPMRGILQMYDVGGRQVAIEKFEHNQFIFKATNLKPGYYTYKIIGQDGPIAVGKVVVVR